MEQKQTKLRVLIKTLVVDSCLDTSLHGIPHILKESSHVILRLIWIVCFLVSGCFCLYFLVTTFIQYYSYSSYLNIQTVEEIPTQFPQVSFCNIKTLNYSNPQSQSYYQAASNLLPQKVTQSPFDWIIQFSFFVKIMV